MSARSRRSRPICATTPRSLPRWRVVGGGKAGCQPADVGGVAAGMVAAKERPAAAGKTYELGGPRIYTFKELLELLLQQIQRDRLLLPVPWGVARLQAAFLELLPVPPLTRDQVTLLEVDNIVAPNAAGLADLGITPTAAEIILPTYLERFRPHGYYSRTEGA